jgi:hypothetical protein
MVGETPTISLSLQVEHGPKPQATLAQKLTLALVMPGLSVTRELRPWQRLDQLVCGEEIIVERNRLGAVARSE